MQDCLTIRMAVRWLQVIASLMSYSDLSLVSHKRKGQTFGILLCTCAWAFVNVISPFQNTHRQKQQLLLPVCQWVVFITSIYSALLKGYSQHSQGICKYLSIREWGCSGALGRLLRSHFIRTLLINWNNYILPWVVYLDKWGWTRSGQESINMIWDLHFFFYMYF